MGAATDTTSSTAVEASARAPSTDSTDSTDRSPATVVLDGPLKPHWKTSGAFIICHFIPLLAVFTGIDLRAIAIFAVLYVVRIFCLTAGYHRYFAHKTYRTGRAMQFLLAFGGLTSVQKGPLWWASRHRQHHRYADTPRDPHSPQQGFWWSHIGWVLSGRYSQTNLDLIPDFARYPELRFLDRHDWIGPWSAAIVCYLIGGWSGLVVGFFASTVAVWHVTFSVNSFTHMFGRRRYETRDDSRNLTWVALLTFGEGWHNNHHRHPTTTRQGEPWWEIDISYYVLRLLSGVGIVRDLKQPRTPAR